MHRTQPIEFYPPFSLPASGFFLSEKHPTARLIQPSYSLSGINADEMAPCIAYIEKVLCAILHPGLIEALFAQRQHNIIKKKLASLESELPMLHINYPQEVPSTLSVTLLCSAECTNGVGRYVSDTVEQWLVPGKFLDISCVQSTRFSFLAFPNKKFLFHQVFLDIQNADDLISVNETWESLKNEIRLNILSVKHARQIISIKKLSAEQKNAIIQENIASVLDRSPKDIDPNAFDHMQRFLLQINAEEKLMQIKGQFEGRPKFFHKDIFNELKHFVLLFGERFTALHELRYLSRLISYQYLFRKSLQRIMQSSPDERHLSVKLLKTKLHFPLKNGSRAVLGIFGAMNVLRENELFEERHLIQAIRHCIPSVRKVDNSFLLDRRSHDPIRLFYIEMEKKDGTAFKAEEIKELQKNLPREIKESVEAVIHPVFMPRNEEEILRNIVLLSQQLKYITDVPQMIISFDAQAKNELSFRVILLRVLKENTPPLMEYFTHSSELCVSDLEVKHVSLLRKKYIKEANVFKVSLNKKKFLRKDFTIDLFKARQALSSELNRLFSGIRDFNGGILSKQQEAFVELRNLLKDTVPYKDFLLENFFYSLTPPLHQSLVLPSILKDLFILTLDAFEANYKAAPVFFKAQTVENTLLIVVASIGNSLKDTLFSIVNNLQIPSSDLSFVHISSYDINCLGYIYQNRSASERNLLYTTLCEHLGSNQMV